jgi:hypothetical protein
MFSTKEWANALGISVLDTPPTIKEYFEQCARSAKEIAVRALILQGVVAVAADVDPVPIIDWFQDQGIWQNVTPKEKAFLESTTITKGQCNKFGSHKEAEWTLLWVIGKIDILGLPTRVCDTRKLVDEIIPQLGSSIDEFVATAKIREPGILLAENDRTYNLWCYAHKALKVGELPADLNWEVLFERRYAFEWLDGMQEWDEITCDI